MQKTTPTFTRRHLILGAAALVPVAALPGTARALTESGARALVQSLIGEINDVIASGGSEDQMLDTFEAIFERYADTSYVAAYAMGNDGRRATAAQKRAFSDAFNTYIARKYGRRFRDFIGGRLEVQGVVPRNNFFEVETTAFLRGEAPFEVRFHVSDRTGQDLFFNMYVEGVNVLLTERTEIGAMIDRRGGDIDAMIADLRALL
jgi:phospholipid transport system substrate-binding protein